ncbi:unnamed protein product [Phytomonas sp. Hart1]|nr:unnamed protein product [Phytomonas sp. Hart1]|eukprot:CCW71915.1 unnamed protein product [Phytomonas sp. isolate Hart1]
MQKETSPDSSGPEKVNLKSHGRTNTEESILQVEFDSNAEKSRCPECAKKTKNRAVLVENYCLCSGMAQLSSRSPPTTSLSSVNAANVSTSSAITDPNETYGLLISAEESETQTNLIENKESKSLTMSPVKERSISITNRDAVIGTVTCGNELNEDKIPMHSTTEDEKGNIELLQCKPQLLSSLRSCEVESQISRRGDDDDNDDLKEIRIKKDEKCNPTVDLNGMPISDIDDETPQRELLSASEGSPSPQGFRPSSLLQDPNIILAEGECGSRPNRIQSAMKTAPPQVRAIPRVGISVKTVALNSTSAGDNPSQSSLTQSIRLALPDFAAPSRMINSLPHTESNPEEKKEVEKVNLRIPLHESKVKAEGTKASFHLPPRFSPSSSTVVRFADPESAARPQGAAPQPPSSLTDDANPTHPVDPSPPVNPQHELHQRLDEVGNSQAVYHASHKAYYSPECVMNSIPGGIAEHHTSDNPSARSPLKAMSTSCPPLQYFLTQSDGFAWEERLKKLQTQKTQRKDLLPVGLNADFLMEISGVCGRAIALPSDAVAHPNREGAAREAECTVVEKPSRAPDEAENKSENPPKDEHDGEEAMAREKWRSGRRLSSVMRALSFQPRDYTQQGWLIADLPADAGPRPVKPTSPWGEAKKTGTSSAPTTRPANEAARKEGEAKTGKGCMLQLLYPTRSVSPPPSLSVAPSKKGRMGGSRLLSFANQEANDIANLSQTNVKNVVELSSFTVESVEGNANPEWEARQLDELALTSMSVDAIAHWASIRSQEDRKECLNEVLKSLD